MTGTLEICDELSFIGRRWSVREFDPSEARKIRKTGLSPVVAQILASRGVTEENLPGFTNPKLKDLLPHPMSFLGMQEAADRLVKAILSGEKIGIWSDYDADGATSAAILGNFLRMCGVTDFSLRIPDRIQEGYGPNAKGLREMKAEGCDLVCILDAGTTAFEPLEAARDAGLEVIVIDHHAAEPELPPAVAVVNPNRCDQPKGQGHICAAGMTFLFAVAVTIVMRDRKAFNGVGGRPSARPDVMSLLDLVALGTVCDVVPLIGVNRAFVYRGLPLLDMRKRPGIAALAEASEIKGQITEKECGWVLGPRINAGGRIGASDSGAALLLEDCPARARDRAQALNALNAQRKGLDGKTTQEAIEQFSDRVPGIDRGIAIAVVEDAHEGVVGISAARLREAVDAPAIVLSRAHDGSLKGSARSVPGFDIGAALIAARQEGLLIKGGGHGMAGGMTIAEERLPEFTDFMNARISGTSYAREGVVSDADVIVRMADLKVEDVLELDVLRPFGTANPEPRIILKSVTLESAIVLKETHLKLCLRDGGRKIDGLIWGVALLPLGQKIMDAIGSQVDVYGALSINEFRGTKSVQIILTDIRYAT